MIADLDGDGANDVALGNGWGTFFLRGIDGARLYEPAGKGFAFQNAPAVGQLGDGWVVAIAGLNLDGFGMVWTLDIPEPGDQPWPGWRRDQHHTAARIARTAPANGQPKPAGDVCGPDTNRLLGSMRNRSCSRRVPPRQIRRRDPASVASKRPLEALADAPRRPADAGSPA